MEVELELSEEIQFDDEVEREDAEDGDGELMIENDKSATGKALPSWILEGGHVSS